MFILSRSWFEARLVYIVSSKPVKGIEILFQNIKLSRYRPKEFCKGEERLEKVSVAALLGDLGLNSRTHKVAKNQLPLQSRGIRCPLWPLHRQNTHSCKMKIKSMKK